MPPDVRDRLPQNHMAWFVLAAVEEMDLWPFDAAYRVDEEEELWTEMRSSRVSG